MEPFIGIDTRKGRIRINKRCYDELREPQFIKILINPEKRQLGIQKTDIMTPEASRISKIDSDQGHADVYCRGLIRELSELYHWVKGQSYRVSARACIDNEVLVFPLEKIVMIEGSIPSDNRGGSQ